MKEIIKRKSFLSFFIICIILVSILLSIIYIREKKILLTKVKVFNIIRSIDGTLLDAMTLNGDKELKDEDKVDTIMSILYTKDNDNLYIQDNKIEIDNFNKILLTYFSSLNIDLKETLYYNNEYSKLELYFKPREHVFIDNREIEYFNIVDNHYIIDIKYSRTMNDKTNSFLTKYILDSNYKIKEAIIYNSYIY